MDVATRMPDVLSLHRGRLRSLVGQTVESARVVWYDPWDAPHAASPVVLRVAGQNLELWSVYVAGFGFTWDTLDMGRRPFYWVGKSDADARWADAALPPLRRAVGQVIRGVRLIAADELCAGIEFTFDGWSLALLTQMDDLIVTDEPLPFAPRWIYP